MKKLIIAAMLISCEPEAVSESIQALSGPLDLGYFCNTEYSISGPYRSCTVVRGDFFMSRGEPDCRPEPARFSCVSVVDEVYVLGTYEITDVTYAGDDCHKCDGASDTVIEWFDLVDSTTLGNGY